MSDEDTSNTALAEPVWGSPLPPKQPWSHTHTLAAIGIAVVLAVGGGAVIYAATSGEGNQGMQTNGPGGPGGPGGQRMPGGPGPGTDLEDSAPAIHGEYVVADDAGGFRTDVVQHGEVTEVSDTSITTRSDDGFTQTYTILPATEQLTPDGFSVGDIAIVRATKQGDQFVATSLTEGRRQP